MDLLCLGVAGVGAATVAAFQTMPSEVLFGVFGRRTHDPRPSLVCCGDDAHAKTVAAGLIRDLGFDPVDVGPLRMARSLEPEASGPVRFGLKQKVRPVPSTGGGHSQMRPCGGWARA